MTLRPDTDPRELTDRDFPSAVLRSEEPVVVEFYFSGWDEPWRGLRAEGWTELRREFGARVRCAALETGTNRAAATRYGAESIPQVFVFLGGEVVARFFGRTRPEAVRAALASALQAARSVPDALQELAVPGSTGPELSIRSVHRHRTAEVLQTRLAPREAALAQAG